MPKPDREPQELIAEANRAAALVEALETDLVAAEAGGEVGRAVELRAELKLARKGRDEKRAQREAGLKAWDNHHEEEAANRRRSEEARHLAILDRTNPERAALMRERAEAKK